MAFKKGQSGNPSGRKKGTPNKTTSELRAIVQEVLYSNFSKTKIAKDLKHLSPKSRLQFYFKLLEFTLPKPTEKSTEDEGMNHNSFVANIINHMNQYKENQSNNT